MTLDTLFSNARLVVMALALILLCGCTALTTTTDHSIDAGTALGHNLSTSSHASTNASVTEPDVPRYASARVFVASQMPQLRREAAVGHGENITALARLLDKDAATLGYWMQAHYASLFKAPQKPEAVVAEIAAEAPHANVKPHQNRTTS